MIVDPLNTSLATVDVVRGRYAILRNGKVKACSLRQWADWSEKTGLKRVHAEGRMLANGSVLAVICAFFGQSLFQSDRPLYWTVGRGVDWEGTDGRMVCRFQGRSGRAVQSALCGSGSRNKGRWSFLTSR